jgi:DnaJ-class molecular chaperone
MKDYYKILGVDRNASKEDIKKAFRKLAHEHHPDKGGGDDATKKFKEASEAYSVLSDDAKRKQYDTFGSAGPNQGGFNGFNGQGFGGFDFSQFRQGGGQSFEFDLGDIFSEFFGGGKRPRKGRNITIDTEITFKDSIFGIERDISIGKEKISIKIPPGIESGQGLRVTGKGEEGDAGRGDLIVRVWVKEHPVFRKEGYHIVMEMDLKLTMALLGGVVNVDTIDGPIEVKIPAGTSHGEILRVKGKGVPTTSSGKRGDLLIVTRVAMPKKVSKNAAKLIEELKKEGM